MFILLLAVPISIADLSSRKIPNIYLQIYAYYIAGLFIIRGVPNFLFSLTVMITLLCLVVSGVGMGDCKLMAAIVLMLPISDLRGFEQFLVAIFLTSLIEILLRWGYSTVFPRTIAMAPAIFIGTTLYLATSKS